MDLRILILILGVLFLSSCSSMDTSFFNNRHAVSFNPSVNAEYKYEFEDADEVIQKIGKKGNKTRLITRNKVVLLYKILQRSDNGYVVSVSFLSCEIENTSDAASIPEIHENDSTFFHKNINSLKGMVFELALTLDGQISKVSGYKEYLSRNYKLNEKPYNENYFTEIFCRISQLLPSQKVFVGSSWKTQRIPDNKIEYSTNDFILDGIDNGRAHIRSTSQVKQQILEMNTQLIMHGIENQEIELEDSTGMPLTCTRVMKLEGACMIRSVDIAQTLVRTSNMAGEKIN